MNSKGKGGYINILFFVLLSLLINGEVLNYDLSSGMIKGKAKSIFVGKVYNEFLKDSVYLINYETDMKVFSSNADVYARIPDFFPLYIENDYKKMSKHFKGTQFYYPKNKLAKFYSVNEKGEKDSTIIHTKYLLQDITTLPYTVRYKELNYGDIWKISMLQGDYVLKVVGKKKNKDYKNISSVDSLWYIKSEDGKVQIFITDDENRYPVFVKVKSTSVSSNVLKLRSVSVNSSIIKNIIGGGNGKENNKENHSQKNHKESSNKEDNG